MSSALSNYLGNLIMVGRFSPSYLALHVEDPTDLGDITTELEGGDYERELIVWTNPSTKTIGLVDTVVFENLPECTITHLAVWNHASVGQMLFRKEITPVDVPDGRDFIVPAGDFALTI